VRLLDSAGNPYDQDPNTPGVQEYLLTTDASGYYRFDNLPAGDYIVQITEANFLPGGVLETLNSSGTDELLPNNNVDRNDNGIGTTPIPGTGIVSGVVTLGPVEPTGETDIGSGGQGTQDSRANMTVDFGFTPPVDLIVTKDDGLNAIVVGNTTTYTVNIFNNTAAAINNVTFTDNVPVANPEGFDPASVRWTCSSTPGGLCPASSGTGATINETIASIPAGGRLVYLITGRVRPCTTGCGVSIVNTATVTDGVITRTDDDTNGIIFDPPRGSKTGTVIDGTRIRWEMVWFSTADPALPGQAVVIGDTLRPGQTFAGNLSCQALGTSVTVSCIFNGSAVLWEGTLAGGDANRLIIGFDVTVPGPGEYDNAATLTRPGTNLRVDATANVATGGQATDGEGSDGGTRTDPVTVNPIVTITPVPPFGGPGSIVDWVIDINNPDPGRVLSDVVVVITLPEGVDFVEVIGLPPGLVVSVDGNVITITIGNLPPGSLAFTVRTRISPSLRPPFSLTVTASLNICPCSGSATITSVTQLPATGELPPLSPGRLLLLLSTTGALVLLLAQVRRRKPKRTIG
jgi:uncharacterized repeat protein (TIGR01451 family)